MDYTRVQIAVEGDETTEWYVLEPGALKWNEGEDYPITESFQFDKPTLGTARDIRREEDGIITAEVPDELIIRIPKEIENGPEGGMPLVHFGTYSTKVTITNIDDESDEKKRVSDCTLRAIGRLPIGTGANPGAAILKNDTRS